MKSEKADNFQLGMKKRKNSFTFSAIISNDAFLFITKTETTIWFVKVVRAQTEFWHQVLLEIWYTDPR